MKMKKLVKEGAGAGYTVHIDELKFGKILEKKLIKGEKSYEDYYECKVEILPGEYDIGAESYYDDFFWEYHEISDEPPTAEIKGGVAIVEYSTNSYDEDEAEEELNNQVANASWDVSFDYGWGWVHVDLPREKIVVEDVKVDGFYGSVVRLELDAPDLADAVNSGYQSLSEMDDEEGENEDGEEVDESTDDIDDSRDWSASEGEVEIVWDTDQYEDFGIFKGDTGHYVIDYDMVDDDDDLLYEVERLIRKEYPDLDFESDDFTIVNKDKFWRNRSGGSYKESTKKFGKKFVKESYDDDWQSVGAAFDEFRQRLWRYTRKDRENRMEFFQDCMKECEKAFKNYHDACVLDSVDESKDESKIDDWVFIRMSIAWKNEDGEPEEEPVFIKIPKDVYYSDEESLDLSGKLQDYFRMPIDDLDYTELRGRKEQSMANDEALVWTRDGLKDSWEYEEGI